MSTLDTEVRAGGRAAWVAIRSMLLLTLVLGLAYPLLVTGIGRLMPTRADGSLVQVDGRTVGSRLIGQGFVDSQGDPLPQYFQSRPSAAGDGWDGAGSSGSNWGPENPDLIDAVTRRRQEVATFNQVPADQVPADAVTASGSGLDPDISPAYASIQVRRVASARGVEVAVVQQLVAEHTTGRALGLLGEPRVNVLDLNLALDSAAPMTEG